MLWVAFNFGGPSQMALSEDTSGDASDAHRRRIKQRFARDEFLRLTHIGNDHLLWLLGTSGGSDEQDRRSHNAEEPAAGIRIVPIRRAVGEFVFDKGAKLGSGSKLFQTPPIQRFVTLHKLTDDMSRSPLSFEFCIPSPAAPPAPAGSPGIGRSC